MLKNYEVLKKKILELGGINCEDDYEDGEIEVLCETHFTDIDKLVVLDEMKEFIEKSKELYKKDLANLKFRLKMFGKIVWIQNMYVGDREKLEKIETDERFYEECYDVDEDTSIKLVLDNFDKIWYVEGSLDYSNDKKEEGDY